MKKLIIALIILVLFTGCGKKEEQVEKILSTGELLCVYKEERTNINTMYTSSYQFNFNNNGILIDVINREILEFNDAEEETKDYYLEIIEEAKDDYEDVSGVKATTEIESDKYVLQVNMDIKDMDDKTKEDYLVTYDRINTYKLFNELGYTCE